MTHTDRRIPSLDGIRAIAISLVLVAHWLNSSPGHGAWVTYLGVFLGNGDLGVLIFFVLSGFLITTLLLKEFHGTGTLNLGAFYLRRAFRIFPAFYAYLGVVLFLWMSGAIHLNWTEYVSAALFFQNYGTLLDRSHNLQDWFVGHTWSLSIEEQFYLLWPLAVLLIKPGRAKFLALGLIVLAPILRTSEYFLLPITRDHIPILLHTRMDSLMVGCFVALVHERKGFQEALHRCSRWPFPLAAALFTFVVSPLLASKMRGVYLLPLGWSLENASVAFLMLWAIKEHDGVVGRVLNSRLLVHVGLISYSLYLWQQLFLTAFNGTPTGYFPTNLLFAFLAAEVSFFLIERPALALRVRLLLRKKAPPLSRRG